MIKVSFFFVVIIFSFSSSVIDAQKTKTRILSAEEVKELKKEASTLFTFSDYKNALNDYLQLYNLDPLNMDYNFKLGFCYLMTSLNKSEALKYLEVANQSKDAKKEWIYYLGMAYMYNEKWDEAVQKFNEYKIDTHSKLIKDFPNPDRMIEMCQNGKVLCSKPVNCSFTNIGKIINSPFEEYNPFVSADDKSIVFTSRRKGNVGGFIDELGMYTADIYRSVWKDSVWLKPKSMGANINTEWDEESVGLTSLGDIVFIYLENLEVFGDVATSELKGKMWQKTEMLPPQLNSNSYEGGATISNDGTKIIFSSNRKDGQGGTDLWMIKKEKNGQWSNATNLGSTINTTYDEDCPFLSIDGKRLYFCSKGWNSMGGFDIFFSTWDINENRWSEPVNIGFPINDADDNKFISMTGDERFAYISAVRPEGLGDRDIYKIEFLDTLNHSFKHLISGNITGTSRIELRKIVLSNKHTPEVFEFNPSNITNTQFVFAVDPGDYSLRAEGYTFVTVIQDLIVPNDYPPAEIKLNIQVKSSK
jgi:hypothetical protein